MATLIDDVGATAIYSVADHVKASLDFNISFHSTARTQEEVEIEAKVIAGRVSFHWWWWRLEENGTGTITENIVKNAVSQHH
ncbi:hypothetical protein GOBAR_AA02276 [Gossypium barbadense]|uniref:Thioesterase domain-containing protein n=3 Tax=Gossypium TaxID=3633 RepID=A0ABR0PKE3_GOSAR|nr:hypothetical protein PVK06_019686 [Gossypium arboreum]PPS18297.1 hypothetical protein GOBAR_AA02276 [Gossypium barbadense]TYH12855.1 hypothetical protein ES288_A06G098800v1 [Gossypium darwinii]